MKTYTKLTDDLTLVELEHNGKTIQFVNGVIQMPTKNRFIPGRSPMSGDLMLIIEDYAWWVQNQTALEENIKSYNGRVRQTGMIINFDNDQDRTLFMLKWQ